MHKECSTKIPVFIICFRDLGEHIRERVKTAFKTGEVYPWNENECNRIHASLKRLADNQYGQMYPRKSKSSASGLSADQCQALLSTEFLEELKKSEQGVFSRLFPTKI
jgi:receptor-type tyrosine-protein phosphatase gamma/nucleoid factor 1